LKQSFTGNNNKSNRTNRRENAGLNVVQHDLPLNHPQSINPGQREKTKNKESRSQNQRKKNQRKKQII